MRLYYAQLTMACRVLCYNISKLNGSVQLYESDRVVPAPPILSRQDLFADCPKIFPRSPNVCLMCNTMKFSIDSGVGTL
jgi:hypothetical protein